MGTPLWMAPEQTARGVKIAPPTDVWAIGLIAFQLLTGRHYWVFESIPQLAVRVTSQPMPPPSTLDPAIGKIVRWKPWRLTRLSATISSFPPGYALKERK